MRTNKRDVSIIAIICIILTLLFTSYKYSAIVDVYAVDEAEMYTENHEDEADPVEEEIKVEMFKVYISGSVLNPGVYELEEGQRISDLLDMAGGAGEDAELDKINLAAYIKDAEHIYIPAAGEEEPEELTEDEETEVIETGLVNINTASLKRLTSLPGVGDVIGQNIIDYREANGGFRSKSELKNVSRIGDKLYAQIEELITVE